ncbi:cell wall anchor protein [Pyxidicoccus parkwayensis]|uniref:Cell wall anchor protein n=1 Tax=Pyxidicoccus parkwayensis TaxID=2813578 RepID=A0ABX7P057_9BACT|nr:cell wall anchor protein [Pyxidicoccus parkwaysis]QSQ23065.1 cell wall anchor protein [Pyxidicoccus parkwaysis]
MTLKVFRLNASRLACALPLLALVGCGPVDIRETPIESGSPSQQAQALTTIGYRSSTTASGKSVTSLAIAKPAGTVAGDVLLARIINRNNVAAVLTPPSGWTVLRSDQSASQIKAWVLYRVAGSVEPASYTFTIDLASYLAGSISAFTGVDNANPIDAHSGQKNGLTSAFNTPAITTTASNGLAVWFGSQIWTGAACPDSPIVPPAGFTEALETCLVSSSTGLIYDVAQLSLGASGAQPAFNGSSPYAETNIAQVVALRPAGAPTCGAGDTYASTYTTVGTVQSAAIVEPSGLAASRLTPGVLYVHNEDTTAVVAISTANASTLGTFNVANVTPADWEDVATGPCPAGQCIYMGDIGRVSANFPTPPSTFAVYRIPEPNIGGGQTSGDLTAEKFPFQYPDTPKDAEAIMVHPTTGDIYVITKSGTGLSKVYKFPQPLPAPGTMSTLVFVSNLQLPTNGDANFSYTTAAAIHPCAERFILRTYRTVYEFRAPSGSGFEAAFAAVPVTLTDTVEGQGEAIEYEANGASYFTMSESPSPFKLKRVVRQ